MVSSVVAMYPPTRSGTRTSEQTSAKGSLGASGVGAYGLFNLTVWPFFLAAFSKFPAMSRAERSLMDETTVSWLADPDASPAMSVP